MTRRAHPEVVLLALALLAAPLLLEAQQAGTTRRMGMVGPPEEPRFSDGALEALGQADALLGVPGGLTTGHLATVIQAAHAKGRPTVFHVRTGGTAAAPGVSPP